MIGFEVELSVPTFGPAPASADPGFKAGPSGRSAPLEIEQFLLGGLPYDTTIGSCAAFTLKTDRDDLQARGLSIFAALHRLGYAPEPRDPPISNLEYVTVARDELAPGSTALFKQDCAAIAAHAAQLMTAIGAKRDVVAVPGPASEAYSGIPVAAFECWLDGLCGGSPDLTRAIDDFKNAITDECYIQATAGVIPSALADLLRSAMLHGRRIGFNRSGLMYARRMVDLMTDHKRFSAHPFVIRLKQERISWEAYMGLLHIIGAYMVGSALNQTSLYEGSADKNAVPFLVKVPIGRIKADAVTSRLVLSETPEDLLDFVIHYLTTLVPGFRTEYWLTRGRGMLEDRRPDQTPPAAKSRKPLFAGAETFIRNALTGEIPADSLSDILACDDLPHSVRTASEGQRAVPLEYRWVDDKPSTTDLEETFLRIVKQVRLLNTKHMQPSSRARLLEAADGHEDFTDTGKT